MPTFQVIQGLRSQSNAGKVKVTAGFARDTTDQIWLVIPQGDSEVLDLAVVGAGGLDAAVQADTAYALYIVKRPNQDPFLIGSTSFAQPTLAGPHAFRRIGSFATTSASGLVTFVQEGSSNDRHVRYTDSDAVLQVVTDGNATSWTTVDCSPLLNEANELADWKVSPTGGTASVRPVGGGPVQTTTVTVVFQIGQVNEAVGRDFKVDVATTTVHIYVVGMSEVV